MPTARGCSGELRLRGCLRWSSEDEQKKTNRTNRRCEMHACLQSTLPKQPTFVHGGKDGERKMRADRSFSQARRLSCLFWMTDSIEDPVGVRPCAGVINLVEAVRKCYP
jgi:hypothetical protein